MDLDQCVESFREESRGEHVETSRGWCLRESESFARLLDEHGIECEVVEGFEFADPKEISELFGGMVERVIYQGHVGVRVGDAVYDWTARQFWPHDQPWPLIQSIEEWRKQWSLPPSPTSQD